jgi:hypothetical protein
MHWYALHADEPVWMRAAGVYVRVMSTPQLFIEGNHRAGALMMSYVLARHGQPPFVLSVDNAVAYFRLSAAIRDIIKGTVTMFLRNLAPRRRLAELLAGQADHRYLLS